MNTTKRIDQKEIEGKAPLTTGYKIFYWDWTSPDDSYYAEEGNYCYADENGEVVGSVHTVTGKLNPDDWGLHFSKNPIDAMKYMDIIQWNKFAYVEAYDECIDHNDGDKCVCRTLKIVKVLSFNEMIEAVKSYQKDNLSSRGVSDGCGISDGYGISSGCGITDGYGISNGYGIRNGYGISYGSGIRYGYGISSGSGISDSSGISNGYGIDGGSGIRKGYGINGGSGINGGYGISSGCGICEGYGICDSTGIFVGHGVLNSTGVGNGCGISACRGVYMSKFCSRCEGISRCILCYDTTGKLMIFNKPVTAKRFNEVWGKLTYFKSAIWWNPNFTNAEELKEEYGKGDWTATPAPAITGRTAKEAYADMPEDLKTYIKSLPEYDDEIFRAITEGE